MNDKEMILKIEYLVKKYIPERKQLIELVKKDADSIKYILAEMDRYKRLEYANDDLELIQDIVFFYV